MAAASAAAGLLRSDKGESQGDDFLEGREVPKAVGIRRFPLATVAILVAALEDHTADLLGLFPLAVARLDLIHEDRGGDESDAEGLLGLVAGHRRLLSMSTFDSRISPRERPQRRKKDGT